jgi:predicted transcriptional regulator
MAGKRIEGDAGMTDGTESANPGGRPRARDRRRGQGELETQVLAVLGAAPGPVTAAWVQERLGGGLAYTTVITILTRLYDKGAVTRTRSGRSFGLVALRMRKLLDREDDRDAVLSSFVSALSADDERLLRALLHESEAPVSQAPDAEAPASAASDDGAGRSPGRGPER